MGPVHRLDRAVSASAEAQRLALRCTCDVVRRACGQTSAGRPGLKQLQGFQYALPVDLHNALKAISLASPPAFHRRDVKPPDPDEHVDGTHIILRGKRRLCSLDDTIGEWDSVRPAHRSIKISAF